MRSGPVPKGPRLWLEDARVRPDGSLAPARWCIRDDGRYKRRLECAPDEREGAEQQLAAYIAKKHQIAPGALEPSKRLTADILKLYLDNVVPGHARPKESTARVVRLAQWWGNPAFAMRDMRERTGGARRMTGHLTDIDAQTCAAYVAYVGAKRSASMDMEMLRTAQNHSVEDSKLTAGVRVWLPEASLPRERWLSRSEAARMIWAAWRSTRSSNAQTGEEDDWATKKHVARFIIASLYSGTRKTAALLAAFDRIPGYGYIDLDQGVWHRKAVGRRATKKRQPAIPIPTRLLAHMRRWRADREGRNGQEFLVEYNGQPIKRIDKAYRNLVRDLGLKDVVIHTLRHTAITWALQNGMPPYDASEYFGVTLEVLMETYGHHCPTHLRDATEKMMRRPAGRADTANRASA